MTSSERENDSDHPSSSTSRNLNENIQRQWRPMDGVGQIDEEEFVGNYMIDSRKISPEIIPQIPLKRVKPLPRNVHYLDISEHRALLPAEHLSQICVSHIESVNLVYIMTEDDYERAIKLLQAMKSIDTIENQHLFKPLENRLCAVKNNNEWLRGRCQSVSTDRQIVKVRYIDWGNTVHIKAKDLQQLPKEFYQESACSLACRLDGVHDMELDTKTLNYCNEILIGSDRGEFDLDLVVTKVGKVNELAHVVIYRNSVNLNDEIYKHSSSMKIPTDEQHLIEQFTYELPLIIGEQYQALLSSFSGRDNSFYILIDNHNYNELIDEVLNQITDDHQSPILIRPSMIVSVKYEGKYSRAWIKSIDNDRYEVFYVDWGNEEKVSKDRIRICPESIRYIPWLANRVKFHNEELTKEEFNEFWQTIENDYCQVLIIDQYPDYYSIEIKYDYLRMIRKRRARSFVNNNF